MSIENEIKNEKARIEKEIKQKKQQERLRINKDREKYISYAYKKIRQGCVVLAARGEYKTVGIFRKRKFVEYQARLRETYGKEEHTEMFARDFFRKHPNEANEVVKLLEKDKILINGHGYNEYFSYYYFNVRYYIEE